MLVRSKIENFLVLRFLKLHLTKGNKHTSERSTAQSLSLIKKIKKTNPISVVHLSIQAVKPFCEIKSLKIGASNYKVPTEINPIRQRVLGIRFLISNSKKRNEKSLPQRIAMEIFDTIALSSQSLKSCDDLHKTAEANKVYIQYRN